METLEGVNVIEPGKDVVKVDGKQAIASLTQGLVQGWMLAAVFCSPPLHP